MVTTEVRKNRLDEEDRTFIRILCGHVSKILLGGRVEIPDPQRRDELGILGNMVTRLAREYGETRAREVDGRREHEQKVREIQSAHDVQGKAPEPPVPVIVLVRRGVLLAPIAGALDPSRVDALLVALGPRITSDRAEAVILDISCAVELDTRAARQILVIARRVRAASAQLIVSGVAAKKGRDLGLEPAATLYDTTEEAIASALDLGAPRSIR